MYRPFRAALQALREEFARAANRHSSLFLDVFQVPESVRPEGKSRAEVPQMEKLIRELDEAEDPMRLPDASAIALSATYTQRKRECEEAHSRMWDAFIKANSSEKSDGWVEWHNEASGGCHRVHGEAAASKEFQRLAESFYILMCEVDDIPRWKELPSEMLVRCCTMLFEAAMEFPTPLLRIRRHTWGTDDDAAYPEVRNAMSILNTDGISYPLHPQCASLAHNLFTSAIAFIDALISPDDVLLLWSDPWVNTSARPPFALPIASVETQSQTPSSVRENADAAVEAREAGILLSRDQQQSEDRYIFRRESDGWWMQFKQDGKMFTHSKNYEVIHRLLRNPDRPMTAIELTTEGRDVEREEKYANVEYRGEGEDADVDWGGPVMGMEEESLDAEGIESILKGIADLKTRRSETTDIEKRSELDSLIFKSEEFLRCQTHGKRQRRGRRILKSPVDKARNTVRTAISRALEDIGTKMPQFAQYLDNKITTVRREASWIYEPGDYIPWKFE